jgi:YesN/AraC family two-component response regulator
VNDYKILSAEDGKQGFETAINSVPDLIISDIMMPIKDGIELCKELKESESSNHIPIILLTAKAEDQTKIEAYKYGADGYITKPFAPELLKTRIDNLLTQREKLKKIYASGDWEQEINVEDSTNVMFLKKIESKILELLQESEVSVPDLANELFLSRTSLYRKIKALTGLTINKFIRIVKLKHAARLLIHDDATVSEVAFGIGFNDLKYFRKCFKDRYGILPSEYQKRHRKSDIDQNELREIMDL